MAKKRGNPNWGKPEVNMVPYAGASSFEDVVKKLRLSPTEYESSIQLKDWARKNKDHKYVPSTLLQDQSPRLARLFRQKPIEIPIAPRVRRTCERLPSDGCIESELLGSRPTGTVVPFVSDTALTSSDQNESDCPSN